MPFVNSQGPIPGMDFSAPDMYYQTTPAGPVPFPLFSMGFRATEIPTNFRSLVMCMPTHNMTNLAPVTLSGPGPGVASGMVCSNSRNVKGSSKLFIQFMPATRALMDPTVQNGLSPNSGGTTLVPSQIRLLNPT
ncbi:PAAR-like domain-containing protein [Roseibium sp. SCP14]|uniref:PAAR-like domain-containing protein n=1 Tax=Roseibium sp. SCP14 TaxID=3141375 RepID=UPI003336CAA5